MIRIRHCLNISMLRRCGKFGLFSLQRLGPMPHHVAKMSTRQRPKEPLVAVMGTTGTGKSDLAVDLAVEFDGEIINADAMQMYKGLPIITNQITAEEQRGIPHHLLATVNIDQPTWTVAQFAKEANKLIREIRSRGKLPIIVGGTHYYISSLLFGNSLVALRDDEEEQSSYVSQSDVEQQHPILSGPTEVMLQRLKEVDPVMGARWHPDDRRKIKRSLEIFLTTGRKASDIYEEQQRAKTASESTNQSWDALMFWMYAEPEILKGRLDKRVDRMEQSGLLDEVRQLHQYVLEKATAGQEIDRTRGIWQSIGFKQFEPFLLAEKNGVEGTSLAKLKDESIELTKIATRQYARYQLRWLRNKTIPELKGNNATSYLYPLDSSDAPNFADNVLAPASTIMRAYLDGDNLPDPASTSSTAQDLLSAMVNEETSPKPKYEPRLCELCHMTLQTPDQWAKHIKGQRHRRALKHVDRMAMKAGHRPEPVRPDESNDVHSG